MGRIGANRARARDIGAGGDAGRVERTDQIDRAEQEWSADVSDRDARIYALSTRILYVSSLVAASFEEQSQRLGLNSGEILVLDALRRQGAPYAASPAELRAHFFISFAGIGKRLVRLEQRGLVERRPHPTDGRSQVIRLTEAGLALLHLTGPANEGVHMQALARMTPAELGALSETLKTLQAGIEDLRSSD